MRTIPAHLLDQVSGGEAAAGAAMSALSEVPALEYEGWSGDGGFGSGGSSFGSGGIDFGGGRGGSSFDSVGVNFDSSVGSGFASVWEGSGGFEPGAGAGVWSLDAIGIEGGPMAVVRITAADAHSVPEFDNTPQVSSYGPGEAPWEGQYLGRWVEPPALSYAHTTFDGALVASVGRYAGAAGTVFIDGALSGAGLGMETGNPYAILGGAVIGSLAAGGAYLLLQDDHPTGHFESAPPKSGSSAP